MMRRGNLQGGVAIAHRRISTGLPKRKRAGARAPAQFRWVLVHVNRHAHLRCRLPLHRDHNPVGGVVRALAVLTARAGSRLRRVYQQEDHQPSLAGLLVLWALHTITSPLPSLGEAMT